jgi:hypothetical protein
MKKMGGGLMDGVLIAYKILSKAGCVPIYLFLICFLFKFSFCFEEKKTSM